MAVASVSDIAESSHVTDHKSDNPTPDPKDAPETPDTSEAQPQEALSLEDHLQGILDQIEEAEPGLLEADQLIGDDGKPRFVPKPKPKPKAPPPKQATAAPAETAKPEPEPAASSSHEPIEEDELAALINQAIDQASSTDAPKDDSPTPAQMPQASEEELSRAVDRDIDQAVEQAAHAKSAKTQPTKRAQVRKRAEFDPASNFVPIEPDQLESAIDEAFSNPIPHNDNAPDQSQPDAEQPAPQAIPAKSAEVPERASFDPASNFVPIEPDELEDAIDEAFSHPIPHNDNAPVQPQPTAQPPSPPVPEISEPQQATSPAQTETAGDPLAGVADDAKMSNDDLDALFDAIGQVVDTSDIKAPAPAQAAQDDPLAGIADDAKMSNDDLDALFDSVETVTGSEQPQPEADQQALAQPQPAQSKSFDEVDDFDRMSNDDLDALFADPDSLLAEHAREQAQLAEAQNTEAQFNEDDFSSAWDSVLTQAQDELAKIAENKIAKQKERTARKLDNLRAKAKENPNLEKLLEDTEQSAFDDEDFANQWDQVLSEARTQLSQMVGSAKPVDPATDTGNGGKLSNDDLTDQLDNLLAEVQAQSDSSETFESLDDDQLSSALDNVLNQAKAELSRITDEKLKRHQESQAQKIQIIRESLSNDELASELDNLINHALEEHEASEAQTADSESSLDEADFASAWDDVLGQAKTELSRLAKEKKQRQEARAQARQEEATAAPSQQSAPQQAAASQAPQTQEDPEASVDLASELDALFADTVESPSEPASTAESTPVSETLDNDQLADELENLMNQAKQGATDSEASADELQKPQAENVTVEDIQELIDTDKSEQTQTVDAAQPQEAQAAAEALDPAMDEPQDPSAMINHIDSLLAEHASEAVSDMFETPEKIAEHGLSDDDLEAAFQSPEQVLQNLQEASQNTSQAKQEQEQAQQAPVQTPVPEAPQAQTAKAEQADDDLEGYFEAPDELNDKAAPLAAEEAAPAVEMAQEAMEVGSEDADDLMGDFESPEQAAESDTGPEYAAVEMAYEAADEIQPPQAQPVAQTAAVTSDDDLDEAQEFIEPAEKKPSFIARLMAKLKPLGKLSGTLSVLLANLLRQLGPFLNKICAMINGPLLRLNKGTRDIVGYVGLVQLFFGVILFFVFFKNWLFGA